METKNIIYELRIKKGLSQDELAEKVYVTRQAVSRWENGETTPNTETLKLLSKLFNVSINTLLGSPRKLICQCCGMPLDDDAIISHNDNGTFNEDYCKWCYADGTYTVSYTHLDVYKRQFPICVIADCSKPFNMQDLNGEVQMNASLGFALKNIDRDALKSYAGLPVSAIRLQNKREMLAEEMRVLYVAMTRAKEKLLFVMSTASIEKKLNRAAVLACLLYTSPYRR